MRSETFDVVVVGMGGAGLAAAISAHDAGARVVVLEKAPARHAGGNTRVSGQVWFCPTDVDAAKKHLRAMAGRYPIADDIVEVWAQETARNSEWVAARTAEVRGRVPRDDADPYDGDGTDLFRLTWAQIAGAPPDSGVSDFEYHEIEGNECGTEYNVIGGTMGFSRLWLTLKTCLEDRSIAVRYQTSASSLITDPDGKVVGVVATAANGDIERYLASRGVVLASGGFAADADMARNYLRLDDATPWGSPACTGDGIKMAQKVGADLAHPYNYMAMPGLAMPPFRTGEYAMPAGDRYINVGADGRRFIDESIGTRHGKTPMRGGFDFYPGFTMWTIFDEDARLAGPLVIPREHFAIAWSKQVEKYRWSADNSVEIDKGWITRGSTVRELAERLEIDADGLDAEIVRYNEWVSAGVDDPVFGRPHATMSPIGRGPFYGYRWAQLLITTLGGIRKDGGARALDPFGAPIAGLYCAGDTSSTYTWLLSGGMGLGDAIAFGRIAGRNAAA